MALSLSVYCTFLSFDISIAKPIVFFELPFDFNIPNISYIITVFSFQCNAFLRHSHPPTWRQAQVKIGHNKRELAGFEMSRNPILNNMQSHTWSCFCPLSLPFPLPWGAPLSGISLVSSFISVWRWNESTVKKKEVLTCIYYLPYICVSFLKIFISCNWVICT